MAWIESHQTVANHPKTLKLARLLNVPRVTAVGHLHFLWWWALDYAQDGDLSRFDEMDVAVAADWQGEPAVLMASLIRAGFVDEDGHLHDWNDYAGRLIERRRADAERKREARAKDIHAPSSGHPEDGVRNRTVPNRTEQNLTEPDLNAGATAPTRKKRQTPIAESWEPDAQLLAWCAAKGFTDHEVEAETERYRDYWQHKGESRADWSAGFRKWMTSPIQVQERARASPNGTHPTTTSDRIVAAGQRVKERHEQRRSDAVDLADRRGLRSEDEGSGARHGPGDRGLDDRAIGHSVDTTWRERS